MNIDPILILRKIKERKPSVEKNSPVHLKCTETRPVHNCEANELIFASAPAYGVRENGFGSYPCCGHEIQFECAFAVVPRLVREPAAKKHPAASALRRMPTGAQLQGIPNKIASQAPQRVLTVESGFD
jgi:hypothetical protein